MQNPGDGVRRKKDQEQALLESVRRMSDGWCVVHIHLSRISPVKRGENIVFALQMFENSVRGLDGRLLVVKTGDWFFFYPDDRMSQVGVAVNKLRRLFAGDPLYYNEEKYESDFATWYALKRDRAALIEIAESLAGEGEPAPAQAASAPAPVAPGPLALEAELHPAPRLPTRASELATLGLVVDSIERMNLAAFLRRQPVCSLTSGGTLERRFDEFYFSIADIEASLNRSPLMTGDALFLQYVTKSLDRKLLALLKPACLTGESANLSINLNINTVLSGDFQEFDSGIAPEVKRSIAFEFQFIDIFSDIGVYFYVHSLLRERGYRVYLDGVTDVNLPFVDADALELDGLKVRWSAAVAEARQPVFRAMIERVGPERVVLCRCDSQRAIAFGQSLGIRMFQGRNVTEMLDLHRAGSAIAMRAGG